PEDVARHHDARRETLRRGGSDVVLVEDLDRRRTHETDDGGKHRRGQHHRGQDEVLQAVEDRIRRDPGHPRRWEHAERDGEDEDQHDAEPEDRYGESDGAEEAQDVVERTAATQSLYET